MSVRSWFSIWSILTLCNLDYFFIRSWFAILSECDSNVQCSHAWKNCFIHQFQNQFTVAQGHRRYTHDNYMKNAIFFLFFLFKRWKNLNSAHLARIIKIDLLIVQRNPFWNSYSLSCCLYQWLLSKKIHTNKFYLNQIASKLPNNWIYYIRRTWTWHHILKGFAHWTIHQINCLCWIVESQKTWMISLICIWMNGLVPKHPITLEQFLVKTVLLW